jgi:hypothetical protein
VNIGRQPSPAILPRRASGRERGFASTCNSRLLPVHARFHRQIRQSPAGLSVRRGDQQVRERRYRQRKPGLGRSRSLSGAPMGVRRATSGRCARLQVRRRSPARGLVTQPFTRTRDAAVAVAAEHAILVRISAEPGCDATRCSYRLLRNCGWPRRATGFGTRLSEPKNFKRWTGKAQGVFGVNVSLTVTLCGGRRCERCPGRTRAGRGLRVPLAAQRREAFRGRCPSDRIN